MIALDKNFKKNHLMLPETIKGKKITLNRLCKNHFEQYHAMFSPKIKTIIKSLVSHNLENTASFLTDKLAEIVSGKISIYCILDNKQDKLIGAIELRKPSNPNGQLGAWINENYWGGGRYQEVLDLLLKNYFRAKHTEVFKILVGVNNTRSIKAHEKYGFTVVGQVNLDCGKFYKMIKRREDVLDKMEYDKLVRDKIPEIIKKSGFNVKTYICNDQEYFKRLKKKLQEETEEFLDEESVEELADILEVLYALAKYKNISRDQLEAVRAKKEKERGTFDKRIVLTNVVKKKAESTPPQ